MGLTFLSLHCQIVFSTKERRPCSKKDWRSQLHEHPSGTVRGLGGVSEIVGGVEDQVHLLAGLRATQRISDFMQELKKASSIWAAKMHEQEFSWQAGYSAFSVSWTHRHAVRSYVATQETHHQKSDFVAELKTLLQRNGVKYEEKYLL